MKILGFILLVAFSSQSYSEGNFEIVDDMLFAGMAIFKSEENVLKTVETLEYCPSSTEKAQLKNYWRSVALKRILRRSSDEMLVIAKSLARKTTDRDEREKIADDMKNSIIAFQGAIYGYTYATKQSIKTFVDTYDSVESICSIAQNEAQTILRQLD